MRRALITVALLVVPASTAVAQPYGPAPTSMTWRYPPTGVAYLPPLGHGVDAASVRLPRRETEVDVWIGSYRLRQRYGPAPVNRSCFTRAHRRRCLVVMHGHRLRTRTHHAVRIYWWAD